MSNNSLVTKAFWLATLQRCVRVFAAALLALLTANATNILNVDWVATLSTAAMAPVVTLLFCIAGDAVTGGTGPSFGAIEVTSPPANRGVRGSALRGEAGYAVLGALGLGLVVLAVLLGVLTLLGVSSFSWVVIVVLVVIGLVLLWVDRGTGPRGRGVV